MISRLWIFGFGLAVMFALQALGLALHLRPPEFFDGYNLAIGFAVGSAFSIELVAVRAWSPGPFPGSDY